MKKLTNLLIISAVNLVNGGGFTILKECLEKIAKSEVFKSWKIIVLVHSEKNLSVYENIEYISFPLAKKNYIFRCFYEYIYFYFLSLKLKPRIWFSLHDMTPNVKAEKRFVYMHNPMPFYKHFAGEKLGLKLKAFAHFYKFIYKINVKKNTAIILQQDWIRDEISKLCKVSKRKIIVAYPEIPERNVSSDYEKGVFFFASVPRPFKNFEVICEADEILELAEKELPENYKIILTFNGTENKYSKCLYEKYSHLKHIEFAGLLSQKKVYEYYNKAEALIFPSRLETWGLPISEFKPSGKKILIADLAYAHETANNAKNVAWFAPDDAQKLASIITNVIRGNYSDFVSVENKSINQPHTKNWEELFKMMSDLHSNVAKNNGGGTIVK